MKLIHTITGDIQEAFGAMAENMKAGGIWVEHTVEAIIDAVESDAATIEAVADAVETQATTAAEPVATNTSDPAPVVLDPAPQPITQPTTGA